MSMSLATESDAAAWTELSVEQKRARVLEVASVLFSREGVEFPMPELARAVGVGVGSIYRQLGKKEDVIAALVISKLDQLSDRYEAAIDDTNPGTALRQVVETTVNDCLEDRVTQAAWTYGRGRDDVELAAARCRAALHRLVTSGVRAGVLRADATGDDLRFLFRAVPGAELIAGGGGQRLAELTLAGLAA